MSAVPTPDEFSRLARQLRDAVLGATDAPLPAIAVAQLHTLAHLATPESPQLRCQHGNIKEIARSLLSFIDHLDRLKLSKQDREQILLMLDNLQQAMLASNDSAPIKTISLIASVADSASNRQNRIALYIESRAIAALLHEVLTQNGFIPWQLPSMQALNELDHDNFPAAVIADLSLCRKDAHTHAAMLTLRERFNPAPHLFCLAGGGDIQARLDAVRLGATRFIKKPIDTAHLIEILNGVTQRTPAEAFRVLLVDDDRELTLLYAHVLEAIGLTIRTCHNPLDAPRIVGEFDPDVIVCDVYMPGCNGLELAAVLRQDEALADTPILFLSAEANIHRQMQALDLGADDFLTKPVNLEVLQTGVAARAKRARMLKRSRREHRRTAERLSQTEAAVNYHNMISITDSEGRILYANQHFCEVSGYDSAQLIGANHRVLKSGAHPEEIYRDLWQTISSSQTWRGQLCNRNRSSGVFWADTTIMPQVDDSGAPYRYVSIRTDITALKNLESELRLAKAEAEAASQAKSSFLANMSHELRTPLNSILGFAQLLQTDSDAPLTAEQLNQVDIILRAGRHLLALIGDVVDLAKIEVGRLDMHIEVLELKPVLQECLNLIKPQAQKRQIRLLADAHCLGGTVRADRVRVKQVVLNLLSNAIKYNPEKSSVQVICHSHENAWRVSVRDNGPGIPLDQQQKLFQPFSRLEATAHLEGSGIGLVLCKNLIERMGGQIGLISAPDHGSEFWFALPAHSS